MPLIHVTPEGESFGDRNGLHFYPASDRVNLGFRFRWNNTVRFFRFSKATKQFHFQVISIP